MSFLRPTTVDPEAEVRAAAALEGRRGKAVELANRLKGEAIPALSRFQDLADRELQIVARLNQLRGRKPIQPAPALSRHVGPILRPLLAKSGVGLGELQRNWRDIVGEEFARHTAPEKLARKVLTIRAPSAFAPKLQVQLGAILERCRIAGAQIEKIQIQHGSVAAPRPVATTRAFAEAGPEPELEGVASPRLKAALQRLGRAVRSA